MSDGKWRYSVRKGGLMRCCLQSLDDEMKARLDASTGPPSDLDEARCHYCKDTKMRFRDGAWEWAPDGDGGEGLR